MCVGHRHSLDPELLWLQCRPPAVVPITLAWELPCASCAALKKKKKKKKEKKEKKKILVTFLIVLLFTLTFDDIVSITQLH